MYYLKYRPHTIGELDNSQVRTRIGNLLKSKDIPHALLFVGPKGMGKTSTARIVAKAVNCLGNSFAGKGSSFEPCNKCENCASIETGSSPDVVEQDAASNRGIDEIRRLIKESAFAPMTGRYRVYIIDEAHMITPDAFNALLKTLEEPPSTVIFILATTNEEKVPTTIISRCVRVPFGQAQKADIIGMLDRMGELEKLDIQADLKEMIVTYADNSFRDAAKLLEELVMQDKTTVDAAKSYLGVSADNNLLAIIQKEPVTKALVWIEDFISSGGNTKRLIEDMLEELRRQLLIKSGLEARGTELGLSIGEIATLMKYLHEAYKNLRITPIESLPLEIAIVEFYNKIKKK